VIKFRIKKSISSFSTSFSPLNIYVNVCKCEEIPRNIVDSDGLINFVVLEKSFIPKTKYLSAKINEKNLVCNNVRIFDLVVHPEMIHTDSSFFEEINLLDVKVIIF
jgi:hypothetical protein